MRLPQRRTEPLAHASRRRYRSATASSLGADHRLIAGAHSPGCHCRALTIEEWRNEYNTERPHSSLGYLTPRQFTQAHEAKQLLTSDSNSGPD
ncbi:integrase core domain-containing protein [Paraburkholderia franconis]|uniref:integrase core domain-containing protein n=1 Tax=Paraburkholderia franconis TaxID=2654983 RepID=UPI00389929EF